MKYVMDLSINGTAYYRQLIAIALSKTEIRELEAQLPS